MSNSLYEEAIIAAEQIKEAAENKVKQQIIESMSPQIKLMVEKALTEEELVDDHHSNNEDDDAKGSENKEECGMTYEADEYNENHIDEVIEEIDLEEDQRDDPTLNQDDSVKGEYDGKTDRELSKDPDLSEQLEDMEMSNESVNIFKKIITKNARINALKNKLSEIKEGIRSLKKVILLTENNNISKKNVVRIVETYKNLCQELKNIKTNSIIKSDTKLLKEYLEISKELNNMSRRQSKNYLNESLDDLLEMHLFEEDEADVDSDDSDDSDLESALDDDESVEQSDSDIDTEAVEDAVSALLSALGQDLDVEVSSSGESGDMGDDLSDDDLSDSEEEEEEGSEGEEDSDDLDEAYLEIDENELAEIDDMSELEEMEEMHEDEHMEGMEEASRRGGELFLEIDENMLKREISKMRNIREGEAKEMSSHFGGGSVEDEVFVKGVQLNKQDKMKNEAAVRKVVKKNRILESKLAQHKKAIRKMKGQLSEMNLFNAKLLYANKLMQNRDLSIKQQRKIVESLDNAKTLNEAKILFEGLTESLSSSKSRKSGNLAEGSNRRLIGSSSRSTSSAQSSTLNESVALDRWATLAGIKK